MTTDLDSQDQSPWRAFACSLGYTEKVTFRQPIWVGLITLAVVVAILIGAAQLDRNMALFWAFGLRKPYLEAMSRLPLDADTDLPTHSEKETHNE